jgi:transcriptional regulator with XRE-family HTH domain
MININIEFIVGQLADRLRSARLARNESQEVFGARIGLTRQTYSKMEKGAVSVPIGYWFAASEILGRLQTWQVVLAEQEDLFEQFASKKVTRQRASRKRKKK